MNGLVFACLGNDRLAQRKLYESFAPYALTIARRYGIAESDVADVVQDIFAEAFAKLNTFDPAKGQFKTWLRTLCVRRSVDYLRRRERFRFTSLAAVLPDLAAEPELDLQLYTNRELLAALAALPTGFRTVFNLYAVEGYKHNDIADLLGITAAASRSQYTRARRKLQQHLQSHQKKTVNYE